MTKALLLLRPMREIRGTPAEMCLLGLLHPSLSNPLLKPGAMLLLMLPAVLVRKSGADERGRYAWDKYFPLR